MVRKFLGLEVPEILDGGWESCHEKPQRLEKRRNDVDQSSGESC